MTARARSALTAVALALSLLLAAGTPSASGATYARISGAGSTWSENALRSWSTDVSQYGMPVQYAGTGSSDGRNQFREGNVDFAVSEIPYGLRDLGRLDTPPRRGYAYMPIVAGGTAFMYNLTINGRRVTNLRLSGEVITRIFTGVITQWNDPRIAEDNPGLALPARRIIPVVRSDGSGTTAQFTTWMAETHGGLWNDYCRAAGQRTPCGMTSNYPVVSGRGFIAQNGSLGVSGYVRQNYAEGAITYVEYSYASNANFPVAKVLNASNYYVEPTASAVAVSLLNARINEDEGSSQYLTQNLDGVYRSDDRRSYPLSSYSYMIIPTDLSRPLTEDKGRTLSAFANYFLCEGQQDAEELGYSPLPINLVQAGFDQVRRIPGAETEGIDIRECRNPTFSTDGTNTLAENAPYPPDCDRRGETQCATGTGGARNPTDNSGNGGGGSGGGGSGDTGGSTASGGSGGAGGSGDTGGPGATGGAGGESGGDAATGDSGADAAAGGTDGGGVIDPETGEYLDADGGAGGAQQVIGTPVAVGAESFWGLRTALMMVTALLVVGVIVGPPVLARYLAGRDRRRTGAGTA
ncbi:phosphate ABC transporter substrate-binding protein PstS [Streptomyces hainanensis]|uniref:Phosphate ABC transporter substrate-binding protein PstS n=1 Tax=Streptomyces hainanensis TaxID=402648 RepID=A0A4R4TH32_9ACTN|nr:phosphate ABC transporter substrate-binding protein PstS [Streptomyces hainanensis]